MKLKVLKLIMLLLFLCNCNAQEKVSNLHKEALTLKVNELVKEYIALDIFSGVVLIADKGKPLYHKAFGHANREQNIKNTLQTKFDIGSMNKSFTQLLILKLIQENKLSLSDKLGDFLKGFPKEAQKITVENLLNHTSGYGDYWSPGFNDLPIDKKRLPALVKRIQKSPLLFSPGTENEYSNSGYILLGAIIEKITNKTYHQNIEEQIIKPLKLNETYTEDKAKVPNRVVGYYKDVKGNLFNNEKFTEVSNPDGGFYATTLDILKFYREYFYGAKIIKKETKEKLEFFNLIKPHYNSGGAIPLAGGYNGANTVHFEILRDKISIIVFANMDEPVAEQLGKGILNIVRGKTPNKPTLPAIQKVYKAYQKQGIEYVKKNFNKLIANFHPSDPKGLILNNIGYTFLNDNSTEKAIEIFKLNTILFADDPNVWDSLGEAYLKKGDIKNALLNYKKALKIDPNFPSAKKMVLKLKTKNNE